MRGRLIARERGGAEPPLFIVLYDNHDNHDYQGHHDHHNYQDNHDYHDLEKLVRGRLIAREKGGA